MTPEGVILDLDFYRSYINTTWLQQWRPMVMMHRFCIIEHVHLGHTSCIWFARLYLWTNVFIMSMSFTLDTSLTSSGFMSIIEGLFV